MLTRRSVLTAGAGVMAAAVTGRASVMSAQADDSVRSRAEITDLGVAMTSVNTRYATSGTMPDGTPVVYEISQGTPTTFNVVHALDGSRIDVHTIDDATSASAIVISPNGQLVYFGLRGGGHSFLYRYDVEAAELTLLVTDPAEQAMTRNLVIAPDGMVYGATFPDAKVYSYDPASGAVHDYGSLTEDGTYAWGLELVDDELWVGTGIGQAHLFVLNPETGAKSELSLPAYAAGATNIQQIARRENLVIASYTPSADGTNSLVFDLDTGEWGAPETFAVMGLNAAMTAMTSDGLFYYQSYNGSAEVCAFDPATLTSTPTGWRDTPMGQDTTGLQNMGLIELVDAEGTRPVLTGMRLTGRHWLFDPQTLETSEVVADIEGAPISVHTLSLGPNGNVYTGAHLSSGVMGMIDGRTDGVVELSGPSQADEVTAFGTNIVVGTYPGAGVYVGDPSRPWEWENNPSFLFSLGRFSEYEQDRPRALIAAGDVVAMGTVPNYGVLGGAVALFGLDGEPTVHRNIVPDQSVVSLAYHEGLLIGGTSIDGGISSTPTATEAEVFIWDIASSERTFHGVPAPGARSVGALCHVGGGRIWGLSDTGVIFEVDVAERRIVRTVEGAPTTGTEWGSSTYLAYRKQDRLFYGANGARMFVFDPETESIEPEMDFTAGRIVVTQRGKIYFSSGTHVYRYLPPARSGR